MKARRVKTLKFGPELAGKIKPRHQLITIRRDSKGFEVGDGGEFVDAVSGAGLGSGKCVGRAAIRIAEEGVEIGERVGFWSERRVEGSSQPNWSLTLDKQLADGSWCVSRFNAQRVELDDFAKSDGFTDFAALCGYVRGLYGLPFAGTILVFEVLA